jgi:hypothetical protein
MGNESAVIPAHAGIHPVVMQALGPGVRRDDGTAA